VPRGSYLCLFSRLPGLDVDCDFEFRTICVHAQQDFVFSFIDSRVDVIVTACVEWMHRCFVVDAELHRLHSVVRCTGRAR